MLFSATKSHQLDQVGRSLRLMILETIYQVGFGHIGGAFSSVDIIISAYLSKLFNFDRDHFILSAGHLCLAHYAVLTQVDKIKSSTLTTYSQLGSPLQGHESIEVPGVEYSSGSLGQGLSFAAGLALGDKDHTVVCLTSDGEHNEGQIWEAIMFANKYHLGNLINIVDYNGTQIDGTTHDIMPMDELASKYLRFGWTVQTVDGHNHHQLAAALKKAKDSTIYPACIIAKTTLGKGVSYMENNYQFHDVKNLTEEQYLQAHYEISSY